MMTIDVAKITDVLADLTTLQYFPADPHARKAIVRMVCAMVGADPKISPEEQTRWLVARLMVLFDAWPGPKQLRAVFCSRFKPRDGIEATADQALYPDGFPADPNLPKLLPGPPPKQIAGPVTADPELATGFAELMKSTTLPAKPVRLSSEQRQRAARFSRLLEAVTTAPGERTDPPMAPPNTPKPITQADIDRAVAERKSR